MHVFDKDEFSIIEMEMLIADPCIDQITVLRTDDFHHSLFLSLLCLI